MSKFDLIHSVTIMQIPLALVSLIFLRHPYFISIFLEVFLSIYFHEFCHYATAKLFGYNPSFEKNVKNRLVMNPYVNFHNDGTNNLVIDLWKFRIITLSGIWFNLLTGVILVIFFSPLGYFSLLAGLTSLITKGGDFRHWRKLKSTEREFK